MKMNKIRVGVLGVGHLGRLHARLYREVEQAELIGIYDTDLEKANEVGREFGVTVFDSRDALLKEVEAVNIVTPTSDHYESAQAALENDCHLFIEKPLMARESEAENIINNAATNNKLLQVGHIERFNPAILALSDVKLNPVFIESHRLASFNPRGTDVAVILDLMIHDLDLILSLVKSEPVQIDASGVGVISKNIDIANARIQFKNGCVANITASRISAKKMRKMRIFQPSSYISLDFIEGFSEIYYISDEQQKSFQDGTLAFSLGQIEAGDGKKSIKYNKLQRSGVNPLKHELISFVESISANIPPIVSGQEGLAALKLANRVIQKIEEHTVQIKEGVVSED
jgi:predicted dehydrogenase